MAIGTVADGGLKNRYRKLIFISLILELRKPVDLIKVVMDRVKMFPEFGELYYNILQIAYFEKDKMSDQEIVEKLNLERSTYYRRKKEAILLCGVLLWDEAKHRKFA